MNLISYFKRLGEFSNEFESPFNLLQVKHVPLQIISGALIWLPEETYKLNCDKNMLLVEHGSFICKNFEIIPGLFSKQAGIVIISYQNNLVAEISIKSGSVYQGKKFKTFANKIFYPGEIIFENIKIDRPSLCQHIVGKVTDQLLIRPLDIKKIQAPDLTSHLHDAPKSKRIFYSPLGENSRGLLPKELDKFFKQSQIKKL